MQETLDIALKEWAVVCEAVCRGQQAILLRKGGIHEAAGEFELEHRRFLLYPTFAHQKPDLVKPAWRAGMERCCQEPAAINITAWADVAWIGQVPNRAAFNALDDLHIWQPELIDMRFRYRPDYPVYVLLLEAWRLAKPVELAVQADYAGCRSWVPLKRSVATAGSTPVWPAARVAQTRELLVRVLTA